MLWYNDFIIYKKKGDLHMSKKSLRAVSGVTLAVALVQTVQPVLADETANSNSVVVKSEKLDAVAKEAAGLGFTTTTTKETRVAKTREEFERLKSEAKAELDTLASTIQRNVDADKQHKVKVKEAVDKVKDEEETIKAQYPLLAEKDGVRIYGKFNEAKKGSQAYYENIYVFTDDESITPLKGELAVNEDTEFQAIAGDVRPASSGRGNTYQPLGNVDGSPVGSKVRVTHMGETLDGRRIDAIVTVKNFDFRSNNVSLLKEALDSVGKSYDKDGYVTLTKWKPNASYNGELGVYSTMTKGVDLEFELVDENGSPINAVFAMTHTDIDYGQGISVQSDGKILDLVPKNNLRKQTLNVDGRTYNDMYSDFGRGVYIDDIDDTIAANDAKSIPDGSFVTVIKGYKFIWRHNTWRGAYNNGNLKLATAEEFDKSVKSDTLKNNTVGYMYADLFGRGGKVSLHTPEIPTAPAIEKDFELKEIEVSLKEETTVEPTTTTTTTEAPKPETPVEKPTETTTTTEAPTPENPVVEVKPTETTTTTEAPKPETPVEKPTETTTTTEAPKPEEPVEKPTETTTTTEAPKPETPVEVEKPTTTTEAPKPETPKPVEPTTTYVDENGKQLLPPEEGEKDKKDIPGYKFVETKKKENGDIEHIYKKVSKITTYVDENGKSLLPPEEGEKDKKDIPGYEFVETKKKENGDIEHVYKKVSKITTYVDENGKELLKPKEGTHDKEVIDGYEFVRTVNKPNGDVEHVYKKKSTEKKLPATGGGITGAITALAGLTGVGAYFNTRKRKK